MAQILKFPPQASKFGYKRVKKCAKRAEHPDQLPLFSEPAAQVLTFAPELGRFEQALLLDEKGDRQAAEIYQKAIEEGDCVADAYCNLGIIESQKGTTSKALDYFTMSLKYEPRHGEAHYNLGNLYFDANDFRLAQLHYEMAVAINPSFPNVYFNLALLQAINSDFAAAINALGHYQELVAEDEARDADELLDKLKKSLAAAKDSRVGSS